MFKLVANFIAPLITVTLTLAGVLDTTGAVLRQILARSSRPTGVGTCSSGSGSSDGSAASGSYRSALRSSALQKIGRGATAARGIRDSRAAGCTGNVEEIIELSGCGTASGSAICRSAAGPGTLTAAGDLALPSASPLALSRSGRLTG